MGAEYSPAHFTGFRGAPCLAVNGYLREEFDFGGNLTAQAGWQWRGEHNRRLLRIGGEYSNGKTEQFEFYANTERRTAYVESKGLLYIGTGVSGGEEGALKGPSMMPGGSEKAWPLVKPIFQAIAAKVGTATATRRSRRACRSSLSRAIDHAAHASGARTKGATTMCIQTVKAVASA